MAEQQGIKMVGQQGIKWQDNNASKWQDKLTVVNTCLLDFDCETGNVCVFRSGSNPSLETISTKQCG